MRRSHVLFAAFLSAGIAQAQTGVAVSGAYLGLKAAGYYQTAAPVPATALQGFPADASPPAQPLPSPAVPDDPNHIIIKAVNVVQDGDYFSCQGPVHFAYKGYNVYADFASGFRSSEIVTFTGHVVLIGDDGTVHGDRVRVDFKNRRYTVDALDTDVKPSASQGYLKGDLYIQSEESSGTEAEQFHQFVRLTTCEYVPPHYVLVARSAYIRPYHRAILRHVTLYVLRRRIFTLPILVLPLDQNTNNLPEVGEAPDEGYFVKTKWGVDIKNPNTLTTHIDYYTLLGPGLGADLQYGKPSLKNTLSLYTIPGGPHMFLLSDQDTENWGKFSLTSSNSFQQNDYLVADDTTYLTSHEALTWQQAKGNSSLNYSISDTTAPGFTSTQESVGLTDVRTISKEIQNNLSLNWADYTASSDGVTDSTSQSLDVNLSTVDQMKKATAEFDYQRSIPIGQTSGFFNSSDRTPVLDLKSDMGRLFGPRMGSEMPFALETSIGQFADPIDGGDVSREMFDVTMNKDLAPKGRSTFDYNLHFRQNFYSDDTAQFILAYGGQYSYKLGPDSALNMQYNFQRPQGYTPLAVDQTGTTDYASTDLSYKFFHSLSLGAQTSYDFTQIGNPYGESPWESLGLRSEYQPNTKLDVRTLTTYDTNAQEWSSMRADLEYKFNILYVSAGALYDAERHVWGDDNLYLSGLKYGKVEAEARIAYNGYTSQFYAQQYGIVYDLHDSELVVQYLNSQTGFRPGPQIMIFLRLKAFPFNSLFGFGTQGQPIGTGTGQGF